MNGFGKKVFYYIISHFIHLIEICNYLNKKLNMTDCLFRNKKLEMEVDDDLETTMIRECCVCFNGTFDTLVCGHIVCQTCKIQMTKCPMCRRPYENHSPQQPSPLLQENNNDTKCLMAFLTLIIGFVSMSIGMYTILNIHDKEVVAILLIYMGVGSLLITWIFYYIQIRSEYLFRGATSFYGTVVFFGALYGIVNARYGNDPHEKKNYVIYSLTLYFGLCMICYPFKPWNLSLYARHQRRR